jgi:AcrR family transcriptional regulator
MEAPERVETRGQRSRQVILDVAAPIFAEYGYAGASLNRIILATGLTKGGFYFHFPSKLDLALAVIRDQNDRWLARVCGGIRLWIENAADGIRLAQTEGDARPDVDPVAVAEVAVGLFIGMQTLTEQLGDDAFEQRLEHTIDVVGDILRPTRNEGGPDDAA